jgi:hypothetical protein
VGGDKFTQRRKTLGAIAYAMKKQKQLLRLGWLGNDDMAGGWDGHKAKKTNERPREMQTQSSTLTPTIILGRENKMRLSRFSAALGLASALLACSSAGASTMYKCVTNGQVTYANEPCKGQTMQVVKGNDTNMVQVNPSRSAAASDADAPDVPVIKLQPKADNSVGDAANLGLGAAAPAGKNAEAGSANERFLKQLQAQTQALAQQQSQPSAGHAPARDDAGSEADWPANLRRPADASAAPDATAAPAGFEPLVMPTGAEIVAELRKSWQAEWLPALRQWLIAALLCALAAAALLLFALYWIVRFAVKHGVLAAQNTAPKRLQIPPMPQLQLRPMPKIDAKN